MARRARAAGGQPGDRPPGHQPGADLGYSQAHRQHRARRTSSTTGSRRRTGYDPEARQAAAGRGRLSQRLRRRRALLRHGLRQPSARPWSTTCRRSASASSCSRSSARPSSAATPRRSSANIIQGGSGAFGNAATRLEVVRRQGRHLRLRQLSRHRRAVPAAGGRAGSARSAAAILHKMQQLVHEQSDVRADLAARLPQRRRARGSASPASA